MSTKQRSRNIVLQGILDKALAGNFICFRGYASLGELHKVSKADRGYQRNLIATHRERMVRFLSDERHLFFPEVILGASLNAEKNPELLIHFFQSINEGKSSTIEFANFNLRQTVKRSKNTSERRAENYFRDAKLTIKGTAIEKTFVKFDRIDGNHRLSVLDEPEDLPARQKLSEEQKEKFSKLNVPFCLVLMPSDEDLSRNSRALFHNLNFNQIPITKEKNLELILDEGSPFADDALESQFGRPYLEARHILNSWDLEILPNLKKVLEPKNINKKQETVKRTYLVNTLELPDKIILDFSGKKSSLPKFDEQGLKKVLATLNELYAHEALQIYSNHGLLTTYTHYAIAKPYSLKIFHNWVIENHIYHTKDIKAEELIKVFDCVLESRKRTIFVSMQFDNQTSENYEAIKSAVSDVNKDCPDKNFKIKEIRIDKLKKGHSYKITEEILELIEGSGYLIADLSLGNKNVYHEVGYLMGLNRKSTKQQNNFILIFNKSLKGANFESDVGFNLKANQVLVADGTNDLRLKLKEQIEIHYNLKSQAA